MIFVTDHITIAEAELDFKFIRASGPGGQNVNKVSSAVQLRFDVRRSPSLPEETRARLIRLSGRRITDDGILIIEARRFRDQPRNRQDAVDRLTALIRQAAVRPVVRRKTSPTAASRRRIRETKIRQSRLKQNRGKITDFE
ncbi:MAG: alternative ribosome rescue aminoacyl-tRNA hydrolase ArfB [Thermodesulfobacteriota bacterium]